MRRTGTKETIVLHVLGLEDNVPFTSSDILQSHPQLKQNTVQVTLMRMYQDGLLSRKKHEANSPIIYTAASPRKLKSWLERPTQAKKAREQRRQEIRTNQERLKAENTKLEAALYEASGNNVEGAKKAFILELFASGAALTERQVAIEAFRRGITKSANTVRVLLWRLRSQGELVSDRTQGLPLKSKTGALKEVRFYRLAEKDS